MAKRGKGDSEGGKIEFVFVKLEGSNETIQETVKTIADAIKPQLVYMRPSLPPFEEQRALDAIEVEPEEVLVEPAEKPTPKKKKETTRVRSASRPPEPLDLDLTTGDMPFKRYVQLKNPKSDADRYVLVADWLNTYRSISPINKAHIHTCYRFMGWTAPEDLNQTFRSLKNQDFRQHAQGQYAITVVGQNRISELNTTES